MGFLAKIFGRKKERSPEIRAALARLAGRTVAYADSSWIIRKVLDRACEEMGIHGLEFESPHALIDSLQAHNPDAVLLNATDLGPDGHLVAQTIKERRPQTGVFLLKDPMCRLDPRVETQQGVDGVHKKPFDVDELFAAIGNQL